MVIGVIYVLFLFESISHFNDLHLHETRLLFTPRSCHILVTVIRCWWSRNNLLQCTYRRETKHPARSHREYEQQ